MFMFIVHQELFTPAFLGSHPLGQKLLISQKSRLVSALVIVPVLGLMIKVNILIIKIVIDCCPCWHVYCVWTRRITAIVSFKTHCSKQSFDLKTFTFSPELHN